MNRLDRAIHRDLNALVLFEDDLRSLFSVLKEHCEDVRIITDDCQFADVDELISHFGPKRIKKLEIEADSPYIRIQLTDLSAQVSVASSQLASEGLFHKCVSILESHSHFYGRLCSYPVFLTVLIAHALFSRIAKDVLEPYLTIIYVSYSAWVIFIRVSRHSRIYLYKADNWDGFWIRNKDKLVLSAISGAVGFALGLIASKLGLK